MTKTREQSVDILQDFVLHSALTFSELLIYNYARKYRTKKEILGHVRKYLTVNPIRLGYKNLVHNLNILEETVVNWVWYVDVVESFEKDIIPEEVRTERGRPTKEDQEV